MKNDILEIITQHKYDHISSEQAVSELLDLFGVVGQSEQLHGEKCNSLHTACIECYQGYLDYKESKK